MTRRELRMPIGALVFYQVIYKEGYSGHQKADLAKGIFARPAGKMG